MTTGVGWLDTNEVRRYPLADDADVGALPDDIIADLKVVVPSEVIAAAGGGTPRVLSLSCGPGYISVVIAVGSKEIAWYGGDHDIHVPLPLTPLVGGAGGFIVFGRGVEAWRGAAVLPNGILAAPAFSVVFDSGVAAVIFESDGTPTPMTALIGLEAGDNITLTHRGSVGGYTNVVEIAVAETIDPLINEKLLGNCGRNVQAGTCTPAIINSVNGVRADAAGKISIKIVNNTTDTLVASGTGTATAKLTTSLSLTRSCEDKYVLEPSVDISAGLIKRC